MNDSNAGSPGWLYPADTVQGRADRAHVDLRQRTLREYEDGTASDPLP
jgi:hypothetical protein